MTGGRLAVEGKEWKVEVESSGKKGAYIGYWTSANFEGPRRSLLDGRKDDETEGPGRF